MEIRFDPTYIEEVVFLELKAREVSGDAQLSQAFHAAWDAIYDSEGSAEDRDTRFHQAASRYFQELGLRDLIMKRFEEFPFVRIGVHVVMIRRAWSRKEECVELYVRESSRMLQMTLQTSRSLERERFVTFLRHELMHVSDMLNPAFGYKPHPELGGIYELEQDLARERFRVLWNIFVDGRMRRCGWRTVIDETTRRRELERAFPSWEPKRRQAVFNELFSHEQCMQQELLELAKNEGLMQSLGDGGVRCPLCHFPTRDGVRKWEGVWAVVAEAIQKDFPHWNPTQGACTQCGELYRSRICTVR